eukprot:4466980-Amphidinium_carterae.1
MGHGTLLQERDTGRGKKLLDIHILSLQILGLSVELVMCPIKSGILPLVQLGPRQWPCRLGLKVSSVIWAMDVWHDRRLTLM